MEWIDHKWSSDLC